MNIKYAGGIYRYLVVIKRKRRFVNMSEEFATYNLITVIAERIIVNDFHLI